MMTREELITLKEEKGLTIAQVAERSGVPVGTIGKIFSGQTRRPRTATMQAIEKAVREDAFAGLGKASFYEMMRNNTQDPWMVRETSPYSYGAAAAREDTGHPEAIADRTGMNPQTMTKEQIFAWRKPGEYTLEDYAQIPDDIRVELIDGVIYDMAAPVTSHQYIVGRVFSVLDAFVRKNKGKCIAFQSPVDVVFPPDDKTVVQPDVVVICDRDKIKDRIEGAPDMVVEVLSPSTRRKDMIHKLCKYLEAGVREYWIVDPAHKKVVVYWTTDDADIFIYGFEDRIPVRIWDGQCEMDMAELLEDLKDIYGDDFQ